MWKYRLNKLEPLYPAEIRTSFVGLPNNLDAAFTLNGRQYFIKGDDFVHVFASFHTVY